MAKKREIADLEIRERELEQILGKTPGILLRIGITVIFTVFLAILAGSSFFSSPDLVSGPVVITSEHAPVPLFCQNNGKFSEILLTDQARVKTGDIIAVLENPAHTNDVLYVARVLGVSGDACFSDTLPAGDLLDKNLQLGELQPVFTSWKYALVNYRNFRELRYHERRLAEVRRQLEHLDACIELGVRQECNAKEEYAVWSGIFQEDPQLNRERVISSDELNKNKASLIQKQGAILAAMSQVKDAQARKSQLKQSIIDMEYSLLKEERDLRDNIRNLQEMLYGQLKGWDKSYVIRALQEGTVVFAKFWTNGEYVPAGQLLFTIVPDTPGRVVGQIELPMLKSGKVEEGQPVHVKLDNYPYMEFGILHGVVERISPIPNKTYYNVQVRFPQGLESSYRKRIPLLQGMTGKADVITSEHSLLKRLLFPLKSLLTENSAS